MAFFDNFGKKISQVGQSTLQKTKEIADIAKLNSLVSDEEKSINHNYYQIGKLYASMHVTDYQNEFAEMIQKILQSQERIAELHTQIQNIKDVIHCEKCGAEVPSSSSFCSSCGAEISTPKSISIEQNQLITCSNCGELIKGNLKFCTNCGHQLSTSQSQDMNTDTLYIECPNCGEKNNEEIVYCTNCGTKLKGE